MGLFDKIKAIAAPIVGAVPGGSTAMMAVDSIEKAGSADFKGAIPKGAGGTLGGIDKRTGIREDKPTLEPLSDGSGNPSRWEKANNAIGSNIGKLGTDLAGGFISDYRGRRNSKNRFDDLRSEGLTNVEIAGGGGSAGSVNAQGNTLGSGPATQVKSQQMFQASERAKDRALKKYEVDRIAGERELTGMSARAHTEEQTRKTIQDIKHGEQLHQERFARLIATMADNNVKISVLLRKYNMQAEEWLNPKGPATKEQLRTAERILDDISQFATVPDTLKGLLNTMRGATKQIYNDQERIDNNTVTRHREIRRQFEKITPRNKLFQTMGNRQ